MINFVTGNIAHQDTDVIVNSSNASLAWEETTMNGDVHDIGGDDFTKKCNKYVENNGELRTGDIAVIEACGDLKCEEVYNVFPPTNYELKAHQKYTELINAILYKFVNSKHESISIPMIGTGVFLVPFQFTVTTIGRCVFHSNNNNSDLEYRIVFFDDEEKEKGMEYYSKHIDKIDE